MLERSLEEIDWEDVAVLVGNKRTAEDCVIQWLNEHPIINHSAWTRVEENQLVQVANDNNGRDWAKIAEEVGNNRTALQCFRKYLELDHLSEARKRWSEEEDAVLREAIRIHGEKNWQQVFWLVLWD